MNDIFRTCELNVYSVSALVVVAVMSYTLTVLTVNSYPNNDNVKYGCISVSWLFGLIVGILGRINHIW